jgi:hypothetical protein
MGSEASTAKARTADGAKKKALQKPKQQQTPVNHSNMFFMKHEILIADGAKKKALQKPKQQQTPVNHSIDSFKSQNGSWCKKDDTPKTQTAVGKHLCPVIHSKNGLGGFNNISRMADVQSRRHSKNPDSNKPRSTTAICSS